MTNPIEKLPDGVDSPRVVLIVDDDGDDRLLVARMIRSDYQVREAMDSRSALEAVESEELDCVLLDYRMPDVNGLELLSMIRREHENLATLMLTGEGSDVVAVDAMKRGAQDYLIKDALTSGQLRRAIDNAISRVHLKRVISSQQAEIQQFVSTAAHDLRAPLRRIASWSDILRSEHSAGLGEAGMDVLSRLQDSVQTMNTLIKGLLDHARMGVLQFDRRPVDLADVVAQVMSNLQTDVERKHARIEIGILPRVLGDETALVLLFQNLIGNALKFSPPERSIEIHARPEGKRWKISVCDHGIGIAPEQAERIFQPFVRLNRNDQYEGSGLGLSTCRRIVQAHAGSLSVESEPGRGSTFHVALPGDGNAEQGDGTGVTP